MKNVIGREKFRNLVVKWYKYVGIQIVLKLYARILNGNTRGVKICRTSKKKMSAIRITWKPGI